MPVPLRLAALLMTDEEVEAIRTAARGERKWIETRLLDRPEELEELLPGGVDMIVAAHAPPEQDVMRWLPRVCGGQAPPVVVVSESTSAKESDRLRRAGAFAVVRRGRRSGLTRAIRRTLAWSGAATRSDLRRMSDLIRVIGHNLRGVLGGITNAVEVLNFQGDEGALGQRRTIEFLDRQCRRMADLLDDYAELSRLDAGTPEPTREVAELGGALARAVDRAKLEASDGAIVFDRGSRPEPFWLATDPHRLEQMVRHALIFARRRCPKDEPVRLAFREEADRVDLEIGPVAEMPTERGGGGGHAMDVDFFLVAVLAGRLGGHVRAGPPFRISLPRSIAGPSEPAGPSGSPGAVGASRHVLLVDDHPESVQALGVLIGRLGWNVRVTPDINEALQMVRTFRPAAVLIDLHMPVMDGQTVAQVIRRDTPVGTPMLIGITGSADLPRPDDRGGRSFDHFLTKPVRREVIAALLPTLEPRPDSGSGPAGRA